MGQKKSLSSTEKRFTIFTNKSSQQYLRSNWIALPTVTCFWPVRFFIKVVPGGMEIYFRAASVGENVWKYWSRRMLIFLTICLFKYMQRWWLLWLIFVTLLSFFMHNRYSRWVSWRRPTLSVFFQFIVLSHSLLYNLTPLTELRHVNKVLFSSVILSAKAWRCVKIKRGVRKKQQRVEAVKMFE
jgi:hypothetical protein